MHLRIDIDTDGDAFQRHTGLELSRILTNYAHKHMYPPNGDIVLYDKNGLKCGTATYGEARPHSNECTESVALILDNEQQLLEAVTAMAALAATSEDATKALPRELERIVGFWLGDSRDAFQRVPAEPVALPYSATRSLVRLRCELCSDALALVDWKDLAQHYLGKAAEAATA